MVESADAPINVFIPIGGVGSRFRKEGYRFPKPLINIQGRAMLFWIIDRLSLRPQDTLFVAVSENIEKEFDFWQTLKKEYPKLNIRVVTLRFDTRGAAETLFIMTQYLTPEERTRLTVSLDCDTIYFCDILSKVRSLPKGTSATVYFHDDGDAPVFSYVEFNEEGYMIDIKEKRAITRNANTGAYVFASAQTLHEQSEESLDAGTQEGFMGEYYTSSIIADMLKKGLKFRGIPVNKEDFVCVGTPTQLVAFQKTLGTDATLVKKRRFVFDLDSTLVTIPSVPGDYTTCQPIPANVHLVQKLKAAGHHIIVQTARRMQTHNGNVGAVIQDIGRITLDQLKRFDIPFDEIHFGKPHAHVYVDDLAVHSRLDTFKEIGILPDEDVIAASEVNLPTAPGAKELKKMVPSRDFNSIQIMKKIVVKSSKNPAIFGEMFFYAYIPKELKPCFPKLIDLDYQADTGFASATMEKVEGVTFSHLLMNRAITRGRFQQLLDALTKLHKFKGDWLTDSPFPFNDAVKEKLQPIACPATKADIYSNYNQKVKRRYAENKKIYEMVAPQDHAQISEQIQTLLQDYENTDRALHSKVVHGDPVFSNVLLTAKGDLVLLDMRGQLGNKFSLEGDALYDLAKVYQSVRGYDLLLMGHPGWEPYEIPENTEELHFLERVFWAHVAREYSEIRSSDIKILTSSLLFSLIPLHELPEKMKRYMDLCREILKEC
ncbi:hypothetical protein HDU97_008304 [Phlyctochytrium planicorne]|nr:hypothetical protein HDU97_008304 [Phlyctochytrium planicorne]